MKDVRKVSVVFACMAALASIAQCAMFSDNFDDGVWDDTKWLRTDASMVYEHSGFGGALLVNGSGGPTAAMSVPAFNTGITLEFLSHSYGNNRIMGLVEPFNWGNHAAMVRDDQGTTTYWVQFLGDPNPKNTGVDIGLLSGRVDKILIDWQTNSIRFAIDAGNNGTWDYDQTFSATVSGNVPLGFYQSTNQSVMLVDNVLVTPEPATLVMLLSGGLALIRKKRVC